MSLVLKRSMMTFNVKNISLVTFSLKKIYGEIRPIEICGEFRHKEICGEFRSKEIYGDIYS